MTDDDPALMTKGEASAALHVSTDTIHRLAAAGKIERVRSGSRAYYRVTSDVLALHGRGPIRTTTHDAVDNSALHAALDALRREQEGHAFALEQLRDINARLTQLTSLMQPTPERPRATRMRAS